MDVMFTHCAGLDVHKKTVMACRVTPDPTGQQADGIVELRDRKSGAVERVPVGDASTAIVGRVEAALRRPV